MKIFQLIQILFKILKMLILIQMDKLKKEAANLEINVNIEIVASFNILMKLYANGTLSVAKKIVLFSIQIDLMDSLMHNRMDILTPFVNLKMHANKGMFVNFNIRTNLHVKMDLHARCLIVNLYISSLHQFKASFKLKELVSKLLVNLYANLT